MQDLCQRCNAIRTAIPITQMRTLQRMEGKTTHQTTHERHNGDRKRKGRKAKTGEAQLYEARIDRRSAGPWAPTELAGFSGNSGPSTSCRGPLMFYLLSVLLLPASSMVSPHGTLVAPLCRVTRTIARIRMSATRKARRLVTERARISIRLTLSSPYCGTHLSISTT
jgi:hypothetical protein